MFSLPPASVPLADEPVGFASGSRMPDTRLPDCLPWEYWETRTLIIIAQFAPSGRITSLEGPRKSGAVRFRARSCCFHRRAMGIMPLVDRQGGGEMVIRTRLLIITLVVALLAGCCVQSAALAQQGPAGMIVYSKP